MIPVNLISNVLVIFLFLGFWITSFVILYHLSRFGVGTMPKKLAAIFLIGSLSLFAWSIATYTTLNLLAIKIRI
jgi:hypothetical protein